MTPIPTLPKPPIDGGLKWFQVAIAASMVISTLSAVYGSIKTSLNMEALVKESTCVVSWRLGKSLISTASKAE